MTGAPSSQCARIAAFLADGQPHTVAEIHAAVGFCRLNSRVAELRKRGHDIVCWRVPGATAAESYVYQRVAGLDPGSFASPVSQRGDLSLRATQSRGRRTEPGTNGAACSPGAAVRDGDGGPAASLQLALDGVAA